MWRALRQPGETLVSSKRHSAGALPMAVHMYEQAYNIPQRKESMLRMEVSAVSRAAPLAFQKQSARSGTERRVE